MLLLLGFVWRDTTQPSWIKDHTELGVLFAALLFALATPVGLLINAI